MKHPNELHTPSQCPKCGGRSWTKAKPFPWADDEDWQCNGCKGWLEDLASFTDFNSIPQRNIDTEWEAFKEKTIPKDASEGQIHDQHMAFLSGALCLQNLIIDHPDQEAEAILKHLNSQIHAAVTANRILAMRKKS